MFTIRLAPNGEPIARTNSFHDASEIIRALWLNQPQPMLLMQGDCIIKTVKTSLDLDSTLLTSKIRQLKLP